ncbi:MAG: cobalt-precorrin-5B (C(1))-methyltransferase CbiD [Desulfurivibrio sp.]|nr:cobalt-precorrin-5B (C(1))-methyltransferase CbiD [Desulfurivibrio sp.]
MAAKRQKRLRQGYTTGACAAAAAKAAAMQVAGQPAPTAVEIPFPDGSRHRLAIHQLRAATPAHEAMDTPGDREEPEADGHGFTATVIKDAGDDPDVTNGAAIEATVWKLGSDPNFPTGADPDAVFQPYEGTGEDQPGRKLAAKKLVSDPDFPNFPTGADSDASAVFQPYEGTGEDQPAGLWLARGTGVGVVTKPGLAIAPGEAAINPVPRRMIAAAVAEVWAGAVPPPLLVTIAVADGQRLANKTLNHRLGIVGGLSILGTTGIVRPVSAEAWTATIEAALDVARAAGLEEVVLATGRTSEKGVMNRLQLPPEAGVMMGDYLQFTLQAAGRRGFSRLHLAGMWAKLVKAARGVPQTHVRHGVVDVEQAVALLAELAAAGGEKMPAGLAAELATAHTRAGRSPAKIDRRPSTLN